MLIINADDLGRNPLASEKILDCFQAGRVTSASFMVFMSASGDGARAALGCGIDLGLHLNFTEPFSAANLPDALLADHSRVARFLLGNKRALLFYNPWLRGSFRNLVSAQITEFERLFGVPPTRIDGHQHMHLCTNMLFDKLLPIGIKVRRSFTFNSREKSFLNRSYRRWVDAILSRRHKLADGFFNLLPDRMDAIISAAHTQNIELMTHPERVEEYFYLKSEPFASKLRAATLGTYSLL